MEDKCYAALTSCSSHWNCGIVMAVCYELSQVSTRFTTRLIVSVYKLKIEQEHLYYSFFFLMLMHNWSFILCTWNNICGLGIHQTLHKTYQSNTHNNIVQTCFSLTLCFVMYMPELIHDFFTSRSWCLHSMHLSMSMQCLAQFSIKSSWCLHNMLHCCSV